MQKILLLAICLLIFISGFAKESSIRGKVISATNGEVVFGATVQILGTTNGSITDFDGNFSIDNLNEGTYTLVCSYVSYLTDTIPGIVLKDGEVKVQNFNMREHAVSLESIVVEAEEITNTENYITAMKQKSAIVLEGISSAEISKRGDSDMAAAAKRVTGVTIEGGRYVYVRGLSDRYSKTTLNGSEIPGLDPNRNTVQMDLFPSGLIENMTINKTFSPDQPGDFAGGLVNIETKDFPEVFTLSFTTTTGYNSQASFNDNFLSYEGGKLDWLGMDDGSRDIPTEAQGDIPFLFQDNEKLESITQSFNKNMDVTNKRVGLNHSHAFTIGNQLGQGKNKFGYVISTTYSKKYIHYQEDAQTGRYDLSGNYQDVSILNTNRKLNDIISQERVLWGALGNFSYKMGNHSKLSLRYMHNQNGNKGASFQQGILPVDAPGIYYQTRALTFQQRSMDFTQLEGEHVVSGLNDLKIDWFTSYTKSRQYEPDLRYFNSHFEITENAGQEVIDTIYEVQAAIYNVPTRFYRDLNEKSYDAKIFLEMPLNKESVRVNKIKTGFSSLTKIRDVEQYRYNYQFQNANYDGSVSGFLNDANMNLDSNKYIYIADASEDRNFYESRQDVMSTFLMGDFWVSDKIRIITGARMENAVIDVQSRDSSIDRGYLYNTDILPSFNGTYSVTDKQNLRFAYNRTLARPSFREIAPFADYDFATNWVRVGNPNLQRSLIDNLDARWELYPNNGEILSVGVFYKNFQNPIEVIFNPIASNSEITWVNVGTLDNQQSPNSIIYGAELEVKKKLSQDHGSYLSNIKVGGNFSLINSRTEIDSLSLLVIKSGNPDASNTRPMFGQSPYIVNTFIEFSDWQKDISAIISYNVSGKRLAVVMLGGLPDVYQQPVNQLDFKLVKGIGQHWSCSITAQNLLDPVVKMSYEFKDNEYIFNSYRRGRNINVGITYNIK